MYEVYYKAKITEGYSEVWPCRVVKKLDSDTYSVEFYNEIDHVRDIVVAKSSDLVFPAFSDYGAL